MRTTQRLLALLAVALVGVFAGAGRVSAAPSTSAPTVTQVVIENSQEAVHSTLTLTFDKGISSADADKLRSSLAGSNTVAPLLDGDPMWCGTNINEWDSNGHFSIQYYCGPNSKNLQWGFQLSDALQAIAVSDVSERGLSWWRNGSFGGQNSSHVDPAWYIFHGVMVPVFAGNRVDYSDYLTFRHNLGGGGTAAVSFAGSVNLQN